MHLSVSQPLIDGRGMAIKQVPHTLVMHYGTRHLKMPSDFDSRHRPTLGNARPVLAEIQITEDNTDMVKDILNWNRRVFALSITRFTG